MKESRSSTLDVRGISYHIRQWGPEGNPRLFLLHGFQDVSASWQFTVDAFAHDWHVIAPDWRGYGLSGWSGQDTYWMPDLVADLDAILDEFEPEAPASIVAHSMGANTAATYCGAMPRRVKKFVNVEGLGGAPSRAEDAPRRYAKWLQQIVRGEEQRPYDDFEDFAERMCAENPHLTIERARFLVQHWGKQEEDGSVSRRADPAHKVQRPIGMRDDEMLACWRAIKAPVLWIEGAESGAIAAMRQRSGIYEERMGALQTLAGLERVENAGHNVHHDQPEKLAALIEGFMSGR